MSIADVKEEVAMETSEDLYKKIRQLEDRLSTYEQHGVAKLYYALNRKASEMADMLNSINLKNVELEDPKDKTFERVVKLLENSEKVSNCTKALGVIAGVTGDEEKDTIKKPFIETVATKRDY